VASIYEAVTRELPYTIALLIWVIIVVYPLTLTTYKLMVKRGTPHIKAVYYNRKIIHILAGGVVSVLIPLLGYETLYTTVPMVILLAILVYLPHKKGKLLYWFQDPDNVNEVHFIIMWGLVMSLSWLIFKSWIYGVIPVAFMSFGDGVTGIVRNLLYSGRNKSWYGNLAMFTVTAPIGGS